MELTIHRITIDLQQPDDGQSPISAEMVRTVLVAELRRALADMAGRSARRANLSAYRLDVSALDLTVDDPSDLTRSARALAQRVAWLAAQAVEGKGGRP